MCNHKIILSPNQETYSAPKWPQTEQTQHFKNALYLQSGFTCLEAANLKLFTSENPDKRNEPELLSARSIRLLEGVTPSYTMDPEGGGHPDPHLYWGETKLHRGGGYFSGKGN